MPLAPRQVALTSQQFGALSRRDLIKLVEALAGTGGIIAANDPSDQYILSWTSADGLLWVPKISQEQIEDWLGDAFVSSASITIDYDDDEDTFSWNLAQPFWGLGGINFGDGGPVLNIVADTAGNDITVDEGVYVRTRSRVVSLSAGSGDPYPKPGGSAVDHAHTIICDFAENGEVRPDGSWQVGDLLEVCNVNSVNGVTVIVNSLIGGVDGTSVVVPLSGGSITMRCIGSEQWVLMSRFSPL